MYIIVKFFFLFSNVTLKPFHTFIFSSPHSTYLAILLMDFFKVASSIEALSKVWLLSLIENSFSDSKH